MKLKLSNQSLIASLVVFMLGLFITAGALNGGTVLTASVFDAIVTTVKSFLGSTMVIAFAMLALFAAVWQIMHGRGYGMLSLVLGVMMVAILGPTIVTNISTTVRTPVLQAQHHTQAIQVALIQLKK